jgi:superfamily II DNA/RNA helicase
VGYFNSLRELGGARRLVDDDVRARIRGLAAGKSEPSKERAIESVRELTSRAGSSEIPEILEQMTYTMEQGGALDVLLATNMISVGVDIDRLGLMVVNGQPKATAEYIQATSRIGRRFPGLVVTLYNWSRPRDRSHYERFRTYHSALYRHVETSSVTPFSPRARDRGLHAVAIAMLRHLIPEMSPEDAAGLLRSQDGQTREVLRTIVNRTASVDPSEYEEARAQLEAIVDRWKLLARAEGLRYGRDSRNPDAPHLMEPIESGAEEFAGFLTLNSLREVEAETELRFLPEVGIDG